MGQILVRNVDEELKSRLKERATRHGVSMEEEARKILGQALRPRIASDPGLGSRIAALFGDMDLKEGELQRLPRSEVKPMSFD